MMSRAPRWQDTFANSKASKAMQKQMGKDSKFSVTSGKQNAKSAANVGRSHSFGSKSAASSSSTSTSSSNSSSTCTQEQSHAGLKDTKTGASRSRPGIRLSSSRSFSSLHGSASSSGSVTPHARNSHSLSRLDQRGKEEEKNAHSGKPPTTPETLRGCQDTPLNSSEDMKTSLSDQSLQSSALAACHHHTNKVKKQTRDGVYTLCAMTSGMRRNWVQAVLRNVRPSATPAIAFNPTNTHSSVEPQQQQQQQQASDKENVEYAEDSRDKGRPICSEKTKHQTHTQSDADSSTNLVVSVSAPPSSNSFTTPPINAPRGQENSQPPSHGLDQNAENEVLNDELLKGNLKALMKLNSEKATATVKDGQQSINNSSLSAQEEEEEAGGKHTEQLVKELEKTQKELSQLQQINKTLQDELLQEKERHLKEMKRTQEESRKAELCRRVDFLAQQAHSLVTGDTTTLAQAQLEQKTQHFSELEKTIAYLRSQLQSSEERRTQAETCLTKVQQEMQGLCELQREANQLRENYQEVTNQLHAYEDTQAQKEARLEQHLMLLQASQERERKSLAANLDQAERRAQELQEQLGRAEEQVENLSKNQEWTKEIQEAQEQLQEELQQTVTAMQELQEDKEQQQHQCYELQSQIIVLNKEVNRLQERLKTDEPQFYNLEHSYEKVCEELQVAIGKVRQWETEAQDMREGYERQLDQKEQELTEVLLKMEVLGNSLEETEMKLNEALKTKELDRKKLGNNSENPDGSMRLRSRSIDHSLQDGDDPERFAQVIQILETKLYVTEEKLRDITQRLEDYQSHVSCQDPLICSQLTQTRANAQHLSLLLHTQAKNNQRFAQEMENRCRMLVGRFQVALNIVQACRGRLQEAGSLIDVEDFEKQLATLVNCLKQGEKDAEKQQHESRRACKEEERILNDRTLTESVHITEDENESIGRSLAREIFVVETMATLLQSKNVLSQLQVAQKEMDGSLSQRYQNLLTGMIALKAQSRNNDLVESAVGSACVEAELMYKAFQIQLQSLEDAKPELESCGKPAEKLDKTVDRQAKSSYQTKHDVWVEELISTLQKRATFLRQLGQAIPELTSHDRTDMKWVHEQTKAVYLTYRIYLDLRREYDNRPNTDSCSEQEVEETLCHLEEVNCVLREELEQAEQRVRTAETGNRKLLADIRKIEGYHEERTQELEMEFQTKIEELQRIHEEEMKHLHEYYSKTSLAKDKGNKMKSTSEKNTEEQDKSEDLDQMHQKLISDLQQQHQKEVTKLLREKDQLLKEETAATMSAIVAMRRAHKEELEKTRRTVNIKETADMSELQIEYEKELQTLNKDLEQLSVQHTNKCLENSQLSLELQHERKTLMQYQMENQQLRKKQRADDSSLNGRCFTPDDTTDAYEMELILRAREAEMQFLRQEAESLKEELSLARMDTIYAQNKLKMLCKGTPEEKLFEDLKSATWSASRRGQNQKEQIGTNTDDETIQHKPGRSSLSRQLKVVRSKSLKEGLSPQERMKLFDS